MKSHQITKKIILLFIAILLYTSFTTVFGENITAEVLNLKSENNTLLIGIAKRYPEIRFSKFENPNKVLIELLESKLHNKFKLDDSTKKDFLSKINFITDLTIGSAKYDNDKTKVSIILTLNDTFKPFPKIISTKDNIIKISFNESQPTQEIKPVEKPPEALIDQNLEIIKDLYNKAVEENINGNVEKSEELYKELISKDNSFFLARYNLAKIYFDKGGYDQSQEILSSLITDIENKKEELPDKRLLLLSRNLSGLIYSSKDTFDKAQEQFNEIIKTDPAFYEAYYNLGVVYEKEKDTEQAISNFKKAVELKSDYATAYYHLGILSLILKNKEDAISNLEKVFSLSPESTIGKLSEKELQKLERKKFKSHFKSHK